VIVVDANVLAYLLLPGPRREVAGAALEKDPEWVAPSLCRSEFVNFLAQRVRRGDESLPDALLLLETALEALDEGEFPVDPQEVLRTAATSGCTGYDCEFVVLARRLGVPLVTEDRQVLRAFPGVAVSLEEFAR